jgi:hypothetical protein
VLGGEGLRDAEAAESCRRRPRSPPSRNVRLPASEEGEERKDSLAIEHRMWVPL